MIKVDSIVTISLAHRDDRRQLVKNELAKLKIHTDFYLAAPDAENPERGCFNSHLKVCKNALQANFQNVLVFEDDIKVLTFTPQQITHLNQFIAQHSNAFDILYLGLIIGDMWFSGTPSIVRARGAGAHAYILSRRGMEKLSRYQYQGIPIDKIMKREFTCYSLYPIMVDQYPETIIQSDISSGRLGAPLKDEKFWRDNYKKQAMLPWKNLHKYVKDLLFRVKVDG